MRDHDFRFRRNVRALIPIVNISDESLGRATDVEEIHRVRPDAWKLWPPCSHGAVRRVASLRFRHNLPDRASTQPAGAESKCLVKAVVQFGPRISRDKFVDDLR